MEEDQYAEFAARYDAFWGTYNQHNPDTYNFFRQLFNQHEIHTVHDCACGTGRHLYLFHRIGMKVSGSDLSVSMLAQARRNLDDDGLDEIPLHQVDYRDLASHYPAPFDAVVCLSSSIDHMPNDTEALRALSSMRQVLRKGGILVLTQGTTDKQWTMKPRFILAVDRPEISRLFVIDYMPQDGARYNIVDIIRKPGETKTEVWSIEYAKIFLQGDQMRLLREAGFREIQFWGGYDFSPYDQTGSDLLIAVAIK